ncbi:ATP-dependent zinc metalloprotease FtsH [Georgenia sp. Z1344]|uniref:ATP-dependent zinc metalloprotease FtsH n=1 Tax=Georgenia sp. Z1344 TaxID=3416706 RepID=UPI003CF9D5DC
MKTTWKKIARSPWPWVIGALLVVVVLVPFFSGGRVSPIDTSQGMEVLRGDTVEQARVNDTTQRVELTLTEDLVAPNGDEGSDNNENYGTSVEFTYADAQSGAITDLLEDADPVRGYDVEVPQGNAFLSLLGLMLPMILILGLFWWLMSRSQGGGVMGFGKSTAKKVSKETPDVTFSDVAGVDEAVEELQEIREFLQEPSKFQAVGAKIPKGVLLYGPPGTGKTLLARAVAGEAGGSFYSISGSEFVEMFVGVGASRVRNLFEQAKQNTPAIIFVDEIDAVGRQRGAGMGGGHDEREQTLNQLLVEMDGFDSTTNVILIAATNRPDVLDPALLRPGRFDRQISVTAPDLPGRHQILRVHARGKPMTPDVDLEGVARRTPGFSGADLANVLNEAALLTARSGAQLIDNRALDEAIDRVIAGPQRRTRVMNDKDKKVTAYHEGGHALTAAALRYTDPVTKVTILPRGQALGYTMVMPTEDRYSSSRNQLVDQLVYALGGRVAEEVVFHEPTTGAGNDIEKATTTAKQMVTELGMSARVGPVKLSESSSEPFLGRDMGGSKDYSDDVARVVDEEVRTLMMDAHQEAWEILTEYRDVLDELVIELMDRETLNEADLRRIFSRVVKREPRELWYASHNRPDLGRRPVLTREEQARRAADPRPASEFRPRPEDTSDMFGTQPPPTSPDFGSGEATPDGGATDGPATEGRP